MTAAILKTAGGDVKVIGAHPEDVDDVLRLLNETAEWLKAKKIAQWLKEFKRDFVEADVRAGHVSVFSLNEKIIGTVSLCRNDAAYWPEKSDVAVYLHRLAVSRQCRGMGLGEKIIAWSVEHSYELQAEFLRLDCALANPFLVSWYQSMGFRLVDEKFVNDEWVARFERNLKHSGD